LNLLPIGQLDGGHMSHALFGSRSARGISVVSLALLFLLAIFVAPNLLFWALIVFFIAGTRDAPAANDLSPVSPGRKLIGYLTFLLLLLIVIPLPHLHHQVIGHPTYL
jgi:membrane-associated protease RseP (regulator of RpoE activity)